MQSTQPRSTQGKDYAERLVRLRGRFWKRLVPDPYRWHIQNLHLGFTLDVGCGIGRNLGFLHGEGVGIDHNPECVAQVRARGYRAFTPEEFEGTPYRNSSTFDTILLSHVAEHMHEQEVVDLISRYRGLLRENGRLLLITPQEEGQKSDATHVEFMDFSKLRRIGEASGFHEERSYSFPLPRLAGKVFIYNEFIYLGRKRSDVGAAP